ncbi:MAG: NIPSNAP family protein [Lautropia sp.]
MLVEQRTYTTVAGKINDYLALYEAEGMAIQKRILQRMVGYYRTEIGPLNQVVHMWAYQDLNERAERRGQLAADKGWQAYAEKMRPLLITMESKILVPAPFFKPQWNS